MGKAETVVEFIWAERRESLIKHVLNQAIDYTNLMEISRPDVALSFLRECLEEAAKRARGLDAKVFHVTEKQNLN